jgi:hypothetical protein
MKRHAVVALARGPMVDGPSGAVAIRAVRVGRLAACVAATAALATLLFVLARAPAAKAATPISGASANCDSFTVLLFGFIDVASFPEPGWVYVDPSQKLKDVSGTVRESFVTETDFPAVHDSHDQNTHLAVDPGYEGLLSDVNDPGEIEMEWEIGTFPRRPSGADVPALGLAERRRPDLAER